MSTSAGRLVPGFLVFCLLAAATLIFPGCEKNGETTAQAIANIHGSPLEEYPGPVPLKQSEPIFDAAEMVFQRDPFASTKFSADRLASSGETSPGPVFRLDPTRLRLIRTLSQKGSRYALVATPANDLFRLGVGDDLGARAFVKSIEEQELVLSINGVERRLKASN